MARPRARRPLVFAAAAAAAVACGVARASNDPVPPATLHPKPVPTESSASLGDLELPPPPRCGPPAPQIAVWPATPLPGPPQTWLDEGHALVGSVLGTVLNIDRFFSDERELDAERDQSFLQWRNDMRLGDDHGFTYHYAVRADLKFPGLGKWLERARLTIAGETEDTLGALREGPAATGAPTGASPISSVGRAAAELRYALLENFRVKTDVGAGLLLKLPPGAIARFRLRYAAPIGRFALVRLGAISFWRSDLLFGETLNADVENEIARDTVLRLAGATTIDQTDRAKGFQWSTELATVHGLGPRSAISLAGQAAGVTRPSARTDVYRLYLRYRRDFFRAWIFVELEPEVLWPLDPQGGRTHALGLIVRLEAQFQGSGGRRTPAPAPVEIPEPRDPE